MFKKFLQAQKGTFTPMLSVYIALILAIVVVIVLLFI